MAEAWRSCLICLVFLATAHAQEGPSILKRRVLNRLAWDSQSLNSTKKAAVCVTDRPRDLAVLRTLKSRVLDALDADLFVYSSLDDNGALREQLTSIGVPVTGFLHVPEDELDAAGFYEDLQPFSERYMKYGGSMSPLPCDEKLASNYLAESQPECSHVLSIYVGQTRCLDMVLAAEMRRAKQYDWIVWTRGELQWMSNHPPLHVLSNDRVWIPECSSDFRGIYDRHAALPRNLAHKYLTRYNMLKSGEMLSALEAIPGPQNVPGGDRYAHNSEVLLRTALIFNQAPIGRFTCIAALSCCEGCFSDGCCVVNFTDSSGVNHEFKVKSYGERLPTGMGSNADDEGIWDFNRPVTALEGGWAGLSSACEGKGGEWHQSQRCALSGAATTLAASNALVPEVQSVADGAYISLCSETCLKPAPLECKQRSLFSDTSQKDAKAEVTTSLAAADTNMPCKPHWALERRETGGDLCRDPDGSQNWDAPRGCDKLVDEPFTVMAGTANACKVASTKVHYFDHFFDSATTLVQKSAVALDAIPARASAPCMAVCLELPRSWADKCMWHGACSGCNECEAVAKLAISREKVRRVSFEGETSMASEKPCAAGYVLERQPGMGDICRAKDGSTNWVPPAGCIALAEPPFTTRPRTAGAPCTATYTLPPGRDTIRLRVSDASGTDPTGCASECYEYTPPWAEKCTWDPLCSSCNECAPSASTLGRAEFDRSKLFVHDWKQLITPKPCDAADVNCQNDKLDALAEAYFAKGDLSAGVDQDQVEAIMTHRGRHCKLVQVIDNTVLVKPDVSDEVYNNVTWSDYEKSWPHLSALLSYSNVVRPLDAWGPKEHDQLFWPWANHRFDDVACMLRRATEKNVLPDVEMLVCPDDTYQHSPPMMTDDDSSWNEIWQSVSNVPVLTANGAPENWGHAIPVPMPGRGAPNPRDTYNNYRSPEYADSEFAHKTEGTGESSCVAPPWDQRASQAVFRGAVYERFCRQYEAEGFSRGPLERTPCGRIALINKLAEMGGTLDVRASGSSETATRMDLDPKTECEWEQYKMLLIMGNFQGYADRVGSSLAKSSPTVLVDAGGYEWFYPLMVENQHYFRAESTAESVRQVVDAALNKTDELHLMVSRANALARELFPLDRVAQYMGRVARHYKKAMNYEPTARDGYREPQCGGMAAPPVAQESAAEAAPVGDEPPVRDEPVVSQPPAQPQEQSEEQPPERPQDQSLDPYSHVVPDGVRCAHAIFVAGMPRTGSTLQYTLVKKALEFLEVKTPPGSFWNWPRQISASAQDAAAHYATEDRVWLDETKPSDTLLYKVHDFDPEALRLCDSRVVLTLHRNLFDEYKSAVTAFNMSTDIGVIHASGSIKLWTQSLRLWKNQPAGALDMRYEDIVADIDSSFANIVQYLSKKLDKVDVLSRKTLPSVAEVGEAEANPSVPSSGSVADDSTLRACRAAVKGARDLLTGAPEDPALLGIEWGLDEAQSAPTDTR